MKERKTGFLGASVPKKACAIFFLPSLAVSTIVSSFSVFLMDAACLEQLYLLTCSLIQR